MGSSRGVWEASPPARGFTPAPCPKLGGYSYTANTLDRFVEPHPHPPTPTY